MCLHDALQHKYCILKVLNNAVPVRDYSHKEKLSPKKKKLSLDYKEQYIIL